MFYETPVVWADAHPNPGGGAPGTIAISSCGFRDLPRARGGAALIFVLISIGFLAFPPHIISGVPPGGGGGGCCWSLFETSIGISSPFLLRDLPALPNYVNCATYA